MRHETGFRVTITAFFSIINYYLITYLIPTNQTPSFLLLSLIVFNIAISLGLILRIPNVRIDQIASVILWAFVFALSISYVVHMPPDGGFDILWVFQAQFAAFIAYSFYCTYFETKGLEYSALFYQSWRILLTFILALFFSLLVWCLLLLGSMLFDVLGIALFRKVVISQAMALIGGPLFFAVGVSLLANYGAILDKSRDILCGFSKALYPLLLVIGLLFFIAIPFSSKSLNEYWGGIYLVMVIHLFLFNGLYQAGLEKSPYPAFIEWPLKAFLLLLPIYMLIGMYHPVNSLFKSAILMTDLYFSILGGLLLLYAFSYALLVIFDNHEKSWIATVQPVNKVLAVVVAIVMWLMATPVLNLNHWVN
tara:strand:- start:1301 stop:2395 length:1095 start_codon:yes stop_codon:yes gene_type:complete